MTNENKSILYSWLFVLAMFGMLGASCYGIMAQDKERENACVAKGGTYLPREGVCLDIKSIPVR